MVAKVLGMPRVTIHKAHAQTPAEQPAGTQARGYLHLGLA